MIFLSLNIAPILDSSGKFEFLPLFINSDVSIISASITSYSPSLYMHSQWFLYVYVLICLIQLSFLDQLNHQFLKMTG